MTFDEAYKVEAAKLFGIKQAIESRWPGGEWEILSIGDKLDMYEKLTINDASRLGNGVLLSDGREIRFYLPYRMICEIY